MILPDDCSRRCFQFQYENGRMTECAVFSGDDAPSAAGMRHKLRGGSMDTVSDRRVWRNESGAWQPMFNTGTGLSSVFGATNSNFRVLGDERLTANGSLTRCKIAVI